MKNLNKYLKLYDLLSNQEMEKVLIKSKCDLNLLGGKSFQKLIKSYDSKVLDICYEKKVNAFTFYSEINSKLLSLNSFYKESLITSDIYSFTSNYDKSIDFAVFKNNDSYQFLQYKMKIVDNVVDIEKILSDYNYYINEYENIVLVYDLSRLNIFNFDKSLSLITSNNILFESLKLKKLFINDLNFFINIYYIDSLNAIEYCEKIINYI
jgi:hypothetical protein